MKVVIPIVCFIILSLSALAQEKKETWSIDLDIGLSLVDVEHTFPKPLPPPSLLAKSSYRRLYAAGFCSFTIYGRVKYITPDWSVGFFVKPGLGDNLNGGVAQSRSNGNWIFLQLPLGIATEFGRTDMQSPGIILGAGYSYNYYGFTHPQIPSFQKVVPYFFVQIHNKAIGIRFSAVPNQTLSYSDGTLTKTHLDFAATLLATVPVNKN